MPRVKLSLDTLPRFDHGTVYVAWRKALATLVRDIRDRPDDKSTRVLTLKTTVIPIVQQGGFIDASIDFSIATKMPAFQSPARPMLVDKQDNLVFSEDSPDNPRQSTLSDAEQTDDLAAPWPLVCSTRMARAYRLAGADPWPGKSDNMVEPGDFAAAPEFFEYRFTLLEG